MEVERYYTKHEGRAPAAMKMTLGSTEEMVSIVDEVMGLPSLIAFGVCCKNLITQVLTRKTNCKCTVKYAVVCGIEYTRTKIHTRSYR